MLDQHLKWEDRKRIGKDFKLGQNEDYDQTTILTIRLGNPIEDEEEQFEAKGDGCYDVYRAIPLFKHQRRSGR